MIKNIHGADFDGEALYGNPVLDSEPFDTSLIEDAGLDVAGIDMMELGLDPMAQEMGSVGAEMPLPEEQGEEMGAEMESPMHEASEAGSGQMRGDMLNLLAKKAQARQAASESYQQQAMQLNKAK